MFASLLILTFILAPCAYAGKVELTTYFPIPYGEYTNLKSTGNSYFATSSEMGQNVGIGTTTPPDKFSVVGDVNIASEGYGGNGRATLWLAVLPSTWDNSLVTDNTTGRLDFMKDNGNGVPSMTILQSGDVGIGTVTPGYALTVSGTAWCTAGAWASDLRWKKNITPLNDPSEKLLRIRGVEFDWKREEFKDMNFPEGRQIGMIAQELEKEFPELVMTGQDGYKAIAYDKLTAVLLEGLKAQRRKIDDSKSGLQTQIELLKKEIAELKKR